MKCANQKGVALLTALLVVALVAVAATSMASRQQLDIRRTATLLHSDQALSYVLGAESWASVVLRRDLEDGAVDTLDEDWSTQLPASLVEGGSVQGRILDMQGRFNLNNLVREGEPDPQAVAQYRRLLRAVGLEERLADALVDWIDSDVDVRFPDGAEDEAYLLLQPPYRAANRHLHSVSELLLVKDYDQEAVDKLRPVVCALPQASPLNVNTASALVLSTLADDLSESDGEALVEGRGEEGYQGKDEFLQQPALAGKEINPGWVDVRTQWFRFIGEANVGQGRVRLSSLLQRLDREVRVVRRERNFTEPLVEQEDDDEQQP
jgi:general secretion pathway protein K